MGARPDYGLVVLTVAAFLVLLLGGMPLAWAAVAALFTALLYLGFRYPDGRRSFGVSTKEGVYLVTTAITTVVMVALLYQAASSIVYPEASLLLLFGLATVMVLLIVASAALPDGLGKRI